MKKMNDCIFCKIIHKEIPSYTIYEDRDVLAILDTFPASYGHVLILSKKHYQNILKCDETTLNSMAKAIKKIGLTLEKTYATGINVISNIHSSAGQTVMHAHIHLIPVNGSGQKVEIRSQTLKNVPLDEIQKKIVENLI